MFDLLLKNGTSITVDGQNSVISDGYVAVKDVIIAEIGEMESLDPAARAEKVMDMEGHAVMPGLIDANGHGGHCIIRTLGEHFDQVWDKMAEYIYYFCTDREFWRSEGALAAAERIKFGTTTAVSMIGSTPRVDSFQALEANLEGSALTGIRQFSGIGFADGTWPKKARRFKDDGNFEDVTVSLEQALKVTED